MASYESFARVYDLFMSDTPYDEWCDYLHALLVRYGVADGLVLELGCGTGAMTERLAQCGYDMIGVDNSVDMLEIAREKQTRMRATGQEAIGQEATGQEAAGQETIGQKLTGQEAAGNENLLSGILYLLQDMREFELYGTVRAVVSVCDSMNYITEEEDLLQVFRLVNNYLDPGGTFIFDLNTIYKYEEILAENVFAENREEGSFIWENWYDPETQINEYDLTLYLAQASEEAEEDLYERYEEVHYQRAYPIRRVCELLEEAGLHLEAVYDAFTWESPQEESERVYFVAREVQKKPADDLQ